MLAGRASGPTDGIQPGRGGVGLGRLDEARSSLPYRDSAVNRKTHVASLTASVHPSMVWAQSVRPEAEEGPVPSTANKPDRLFRAC